MRDILRLVVLAAVSGCVPALGWRGQSVDARLSSAGGSLHLSFDAVQPRWKALDDLDKCYAAGPTTSVTVNGQPTALLHSGGPKPGPMISGIETPGSCVPMRVSLEPELAPPFTVELWETGQVRGRIRVRADGTLASCGGFRRCEVALQAPDS